MLKIRGGCSNNLKYFFKVPSILNIEKTKLFPKLKKCVFENVGIS